MPARDLVFLYGESVPRCTHVIDKQYAGYHTLQYMSAGAVELRIGERPYVLEGRAFWSAYPGPRFRFHAAAGQPSWAHHYIAFQGPLVKRWEREGLFPVPPRPSPGDKDFASRFDELLECSRRSDARGVRRAVHLLEGILMELADAPVPAAENDAAAWLKKMTRMLDASVASPVGPGPELPDYAALAASVGVSERTLRRRFRDATGTSPHAYVLSRKTEEARRLLGETDLPIKAIAARLGYADVYFFSRQFRHLAGVPPAQYRRSRQQ